MASGFEKSKVRIIRNKKIKNKNKDACLVTTRRLGMINETYGIEKDKKEVLLIMTRDFEKPKVDLIIFR